MNMPTGGPTQYSPDGRFWWDGTQWVPVQAPPPSAYASPAAVAAGQLICRACQRGPAVMVTIREHRGMILMMQWIHAKGPFCKPCGMRVLKQMMGRTLVLGWWGLFSFFIGTPFALLSDVYAWAKLRALPDPA